MEEHKISIEVETLVDRELQEITQTTYMQHVLSRKMRAMNTYVTSLQEDGIKNALIELGWTPPKDAK